jgi:2,3-bisphosphoglycerate-independent phosphoglycerate mutase
MASRGLLIVLDGWGHSPDPRHNALLQAGTPVLDRLVARHAATLLAASGPAVGLPAGAPGNSEVGHITLGAGRVIDYESTRVERAAAAGEIQRHPRLLAALAAVRARGGAVHILGLASDGNVHSHVDHCRPLLEAAARAGMARVFLHLFTDGRDATSGTAPGFVARAEAIVAAAGAGRIASVVGRAYAMDKHRAWAKTEAAWALLARGTGRPVQSAADAVQAAYAAGLDDEHVPPAAVVDAAGVPIGALRTGDLVLAFNFRGDRMHQLLRALVDPVFDAFARPDHPRVDALTLTDYRMKPPLPCLFEHVGVEDTLGDVLERHGRPNLRVSETEKYPHVTFFLNGREERARRFEERVHVPGPTTTDYRQRPEMSAAAVVDAVQAGLGRGFDLVVTNLVNADTVGHTGDLEAAKHAARVIDVSLGRLVEAAGAAGCWTAVCGDHGNAEVMFDEHANAPHVGHTENPVPFLLVEPRRPRALVPRGGTLADVAPTVLDLLGLPIPAAMTGRSLLAAEPGR